MPTVFAPTGLRLLAQGCRDFAATLGSMVMFPINPNGVASLATKRRNPVGVRGSFPAKPQGSREDAGTLGSTMKPRWGKYPSRGPKFQGFLRRLRTRSLTAGGSPWPQIRPREVYQPESSHLQSERVCHLSSRRLAFNQWPPFSSEARMRAEEAVGTGLQNPTVSNAPSLTTRGVVWRAFTAAGRIR